MRSSPPQVSWTGLPAGRPPGLEGDCGAPIALDEASDAEDGPVCLSDDEDGPVCVSDEEAADLGATT